MFFEIRRCERCNQKYYAKNKNQKLCQDPCKSRGKQSIEEANAAWGSRVEKKRKMNSLHDYGW